MVRISKNRLSNKIVRAVYWFLATLFMFAAAGVAISVLTPGPTEDQVMKWMQGMMSAMHSSLMGAASDNAEVYRSLLNASARLSLIMVLIGILTGVFLRLWRKYD